MKDLASIRKKLNLTQAEMADKLDISFSYYQKIENGYRKPSYNFINKFTEIFPEVDVSIFFQNNSH